MSKRLALFDKMIADGSLDPFHHYGRAMELRSLARKEEALGAFDALIARFPNYVPSYLMAAQVAHELQAPDRARQIAQAGILIAQTEGNDHALSELQAFVEGL